MSNIKKSFRRHPTFNPDRNYSYYLYEPELKKRHMKALPTEEMYRYFPNESDIITINENPKDNYRFIFCGMKKTEFEEEKLKEFNKFLEEKMKKKNIDIFLPDWWIESDTMRYLQASNYDFKKVYELIKENIKNTEDSLRIIDRRIRYILNSGLIYMHGRDCHFRPIIVVEAEKANELMDKMGYTFEELSQALLFFMNYMVNYMLIPGQIENWFLICDLNNIGVTKMPLFKKILSALSKFRCRVIKNYILNLSGFVKFALQSALSFMGSSSAKKIVVVEKNHFEIIQEFILKENLQEKHGGTSPDLIPGDNNLFPPVVPSEIYKKPGEILNIVTPEIYKEMCLECIPFKPYTVCESYVKLWQKEKEEEEQKILMKKSSNIDEDINKLIFKFEKEMNLMKINNSKYKKYESNVFDTNIIKNFFDGINEE